MRDAIRRGNVWAISTLVWTMACAMPWFAQAQQPQQSSGASRPNILWLTCEDISPNLGCYGDRYAVTPSLDKLATQSVRYTHAFAPIGVCAPSRSCLILGMYPTSVGTQHMRCSGQLPAGVECYSAYLRRAGYYCTNNSKTDYNFNHAKDSWDELSNTAHWKNRKPGQPFFAVFNYTSTHESQIRLAEKAFQARVAGFTAAERHDPAKAPVPAYHPDTPEVRQDWARYADNITFMDKQVAKALAELDEAGLAENTIVFFYSDHGAGMPRSKRWLYESSTRVPCLIRFPQAWQKLAPAAPGESVSRLVSFVDFGPTLLSLAGVPVPKHMQGQPFLGSQAAAPREYVYGFRDRMDERYDLLRAVRDQRYRYIRNYNSHLPWFHEQHVSYMYEMPTMQVWQKLADAGQLTGDTAVFMAKNKPFEELYDLESDPHEVRNLAASPEHQATLARHRGALDRWEAETIDLGLLPEGDLRTRFGKEPPYDAVRKNPQLYPREKIAAAAKLANERNPANAAKLAALLADDDSAVRYWGATGLGALGPLGIAQTELLQKALTDQAGWVRVAAADALCRMGHVGSGLPVLMAALADSNEFVRLAAINSVDRLGDVARPALGRLQESLKDKNQYVVRVAEHAVRALGGAVPKKAAE